MATSHDRLSPGNDLRLRSQLFVPGNRPDWMRTALNYAVDALVLDLEDAVPDHERATALRQTADFVAEHGVTMPCFVRVSSIQRTSVLDELSVLIEAGVRGFVLPKVERPRDVETIDVLTGWLEVSNDREEAGTWLAPGLETAYAIRFAYDIAVSSPRIRSMSIPSPRGGDVERAVGYRWSPQGMETLAMRSMGLLSLRAADVKNILAAVWTDVADLDGLRAFAEQSRSIGFTGMTVIHPSHLDVVNDVFRITPDEVEYHQALIAALETAMAEGRAAIDFRGSMVDIAMIETSRRVVAAADDQDRPTAFACSPTVEASGSDGALESPDRTSASNVPTRIEETR